jgi:hypothetical protein
MAIDDDLWRVFVAQRAGEFTNHVGLLSLILSIEGFMEGIVIFV